MRLMLAFVTLGGVLIYSALQLAREATGAWWVIVAIEAYFAFCLLTLAVIYGLKQAGFPVDELFLRPGWAPLVRAALLPYLVIAGTVLDLARRIDHEDLLNEITPGLFIGRLPFASERVRLKAAGVDAILNLCWEFPRLSGIAGDSDLKSTHIPLLDGAPPSLDQFREAVAQVVKWRAEGKTVLIHCAQGHGRSATIAAAALCELGLATDAQAAISLIRAARPRAKPSVGQKLALVGFLTHQYEVSGPEPVVPERDAP